MSQSFAFPTTLYLVPGALQALSDVSVNPGAPQDGYPLVWNNTSGFWEAGTVPKVNGLRFPSSQTANADPNTLDDYEEAFFTPSVGDAGGFNPATGLEDLQFGGYSIDQATSGVYTKIGNIVNYSGFIGINGKPSRDSSRGIVASAPFPGSSLLPFDVQAKPNTLSSYSGSWSLGTCGPLKFAPTYLSLYKSSSLSSGYTTVTLGDIVAGVRIIFSLTYITN